MQHVSNTNLMYDPTNEMDAYRLCSHLQQIAIYHFPFFHFYSTIQLESSFT